MKATIVNFSGNVGKSTIAKHLLAPRIGTEVISVETINGDEGGTRVKAGQFDIIQEYLLDNDNAVIDVGASNIEQFMAAMLKYRSSHEDIDMFIVPVVPDLKQQADTMGTVDALAALGIPASKIKLVFNQVEYGEPVEQTFSALLAYAKAEKKCKVSPAAVIYRNELFTKTKELGVTVHQLVEDTTDYKEARKTAKTEEEKDRATQMLLAKRLAPTVHENLDSVYKALIK
jgi:hypothetical protein